MIVIYIYIERDEKKNMACYYLKSMNLFKKNEKKFNHTQGIKARYSVCIHFLRMIRSERYDMHTIVQRTLNTIYDTRKL